MKPVQDNSDSSDTEIQKKKTLHFSLTDNQRGRHPAEQPSCGHLSDDRARETQRQVWDHRWCPWKRPADRCGNGPRQGAVILVLILYVYTINICIVPPWGRWPALPQLTVFCSMCAIFKFRNMYTDIRIHTWRKVWSCDRRVWMLFWSFY